MKQPVNDNHTHKSLMKTINPMIHTDLNIDLFQNIFLSLKSSMTFFAH